MFNSIDKLTRHMERRWRCKVSPVERQLYCISVQRRRSKFGENFYFLPTEWLGCPSLLHSRHVRASNSEEVCQLVEQCSWAIPILLITEMISINDRGERHGLTIQANRFLTSLHLRKAPFDSCNKLMANSSDRNVSPP